jgi:hypothetical protein
MENRTMTLNTDKVKSAPRQEDANTVESNNMIITQNNGNTSTQVEQFLRSIGRGDAEDTIYLRALPPKMPKSGFDDEKARSIWPQFFYDAFDKKGRKYTAKSAIKMAMRGNKIDRYWGVNTKRVDGNAIDYLTKLNNDGWAIYLVVNPGGHDVSQITHANCLFWESDNKTKPEQLDQFKTYASMWGGGCAVETKNSIHAYIRTSEVINRDEFSGLQRRLIQLMDSDGNINDLPRLMRLPGFDHTSIDLSYEMHRSPINLIATSDTVADLDNVIASLPELAEPERKVAIRPDQAHLSTTFVISGDVRYDNAGRPYTLKMVEEAILWIDPYEPGYERYEDLIPMMGGMITDLGELDALTILDNWDGFGPETYKKAQGLNKGGAGIEKLFSMARKAGWIDPRYVKKHKLTQEEIQADFDAKSNQWVTESERIWPVTKTFHQRYLPSGEVSLKSGVISMVSSPCGSGKTVAAKDIITRFANANGLEFNEIKIRVVGYRNALGQQTARKWGIDHIHLLAKDDNPDYVDRLALCVDSILKIKIETVGLFEVWVWDEVVAVLKHLLGGGTLGKRQGEVVMHIFALMRKVLTSGGACLCMQENIEDYAITQFMNLVGNHFPMELYENTYYGNKYNITMGNGNVNGLLSALLSDLSQGQKIIFVSDGQKTLEQFQYVVENSGLCAKVLRIDSTTADTELSQRFMVEPDAVLEEGRYDLVLVSPSAESGCSIEIPGYDKVYGAFSHLDLDVQIQMLERYRLPVPRVVYCCDANNTGRNRVDVDAIMQQDKQRMVRAIELSNVNQHLYDVIDADPTNERKVKWTVDQLVQINNVGGSEFEVTFNRAKSTFEAVRNQRLSEMFKRLKFAMIQRENNVTTVEWQHDKFVADAISVAAEQRWDNHAEILHDAPGDMDVDVARATLASGRASRAKAANAEKTLMVKVELPGVEDRIDFEFIRQVYIKEKKKPIKCGILDLAIEYPEIAQMRDAQSVISPKLNVWSQAGNLIDKANIMRQAIVIIGRPQPGETHTNDSEVCIKLYNFFQANAIAYQRAFGKPLRALCSQLKDEYGKVIREAYTAGQFYREFWRELGYKATCLKNASVDGKRIRHYEFNLDCEYRQIVMDGLKNRYAETIEKAHQQSVKAEACSRSIGNEVTNKTTARLKDFGQNVLEKVGGLSDAIAEIMIEYGQKVENFTLTLA